MGNSTGSGENLQAMAVLLVSRGVSVNRAHDEEHEEHPGNIKYTSFYTITYFFICS